MISREDLELGVRLGEHYPLLQPHARAVAQGEVERVLACERR
jgi:hypothetical protein